MTLQAPAPGEADGLPWPRRAVAGAAQLTGITTVLIDAYSVNLALPTIAVAFDRDPATVTGIVTAYQVVVIAALLPMAALAQKLGYARIYILGLVVFAAMAAFSALAPSFETLVAARMAQGLAASGIIAVNLALLRNIVPAAMLGRALGINAMVVALSSSLGPTVAGFILAVADWHWIFGLAVPFALLAAVGGWFSFPETTRMTGRIDLAGAGLSAVTFGALLMALAGFGQGWPLAAVLGTAAAGLGATVVLVLRMRGQTDPVLPVDLLRIRIFALSVTVSLCAFATQMLTFVTLPFHLQNGLGLSTIQTGLILSGWPLAVALIAPVAGWVSDRASPGLLGMIGLLLMALCLASLWSLTEGAQPLLIGAALAVGGLGFGLFQTPNNRAMMSVAPRTRSSAAGAFLSTARLLGQALGTALAALALSGRLGEGAQAGLAMGVGIAVLGAAVSLTRGLARPRSL